MSLSPLHKHLVRRTFTQLVTHQEATISLFSQRLRELYPALSPLFLAQPGATWDRALEMLALIISLMDDPAALRAQIRQIQVRQREFQIAGEHFRQAGQALLWVIEQQLGEIFTHDMQMAWLQFYQFLARVAAESPRDT